jgi:hypothetical protein
MTQLYVILGIAGWAWTIAFFAVYAVTGRRGGKALRDSEGPGQATS